EPRLRADARLGGDGDRGHVGCPDHRSRRQAALHGDEVRRRAATQRSALPPIPGPVPGIGPVPRPGRKEPTMSDIALLAAVAERQASRAHALGRFRASDRLFGGLTRGAAILVLLLLGGVMVALLVGAWPALSTF